MPSNPFRNLMIPAESGWNAALIGDLRGRTAIVTGANSGMGYQTARKLAENGCKVYMVVRSKDKGEAAAAQIRADFGDAVALEVLQCDFWELRNVVGLIEAFRSATSAPLDILVCMAGVFYPGPFAMTPDGIEQTLQINFYAHALLTLGVLDRLRAQPGSRVIMMASGFELLTGKMQWNNLRGDKYTGSGSVPYGTSKVMKIMFARELSARVPECDFFAVHPGLVSTPLYSKAKGLPEYPLGALIKATAPYFGQDAKRGSISTLFAATEQSLSGLHFAYFAPSLLFFNLFMGKRTPGNPAVRNRAACWRLFDEVADILSETVDPKIMHVPMHPDDAFAK